MKLRQIHKRRGFTLVELLTTLAVIGVLLGLLIPALNQVGKMAANVKQKAQFHAIGTALEAFRNDYGDYPPSTWNGSVPNITTASHNLAEALVGRDGLGFHPRSEFLSDGMADVNGDGANELIYDAVNGIDVLGYLETPAENLAARKGPYLELENANAVLLQNLSVNRPNLDQEGYVLVDMYKQVKNAATGKEVGMPILYYKANKLKIGNEPYPTSPKTWADNTFNLNDSFCGSLGFIGGIGHYGGDVLSNASIFYNAIANPNFTSPPRPYRAESFILQSAGPDGLYGTADDVFNFDQDN